MAGAVDLVEVAVESADAVGDPAAAGPLPHQGVAARGGDAAEELRARAAAVVEAPAVRGLADVAGGLRLVGPLVGVRDAAVTGAGEDRLPHRWRGVDPRLVRRVGLDVAPEPVEDRPVQD